METIEKTIITVMTKVNAPIEKVWKYWTSPDDIIKWNNASEDWHTPRAENDLRPGGKFNYRMEAKDGSIGFDFFGIYTDVIVNSQMDYTLGDDRKVNILFFAVDNETEIVQTFEAEDTNSIEMQQIGWQSILDNFKKYAENNGAKQVIEYK
jgi:uncharacterized protein YndB with AHSA1/START domain